MSGDESTPTAQGDAGEGGEGRGRADEAARLFAELAPRFLTAPGVTEGTGFGSHPGLRVGGKIFAMVGRDELVVKLPRERVDQLVASGVAARFEPRRDGRLMKEWATVPVGHAREWEALAAEALQFVGGGGKDGRR